MKKLLFVFVIAFILVSCEKDNTPQESSKRIKGVYEIIGNDTIPKEEYSYVGEQLSVWKRYTDGVLYATANLSYEGNMVRFDWMDGSSHVQLHECDFTDGKLTERRFYEMDNGESLLRTVANYTYEDEKLTFYVQKSSSEGVMKTSSEYSYTYSGDNLVHYFLTAYVNYQTPVKVAEGDYTYTDGSLSTIIVNIRHPYDTIMKLDRMFELSYTAGILTSTKYFEYLNENWSLYRDENYRYDDEGYLIKTSAAGFPKSLIYVYEPGLGNTSVVTRDPSDIIIPYPIVN